MTLSHSRLSTEISITSGLLIPLLLPCAQSISLAASFEKFIDQQETSYRASIHPTQSEAAVLVAIRRMPCRVGSPSRGQAGMPLGSTHLSPASIDASDADVALERCVLISRLESGASIIQAIYCS